MTSTLESKFRDSLWVSPVLLGLFVLGIIAVCVSLLGEEQGTENADQLVVILAILIGVVGYNTYHAVKRFIKVTVTPDLLVLRYLLLNSEKKVDYADIERVSVVSAKAVRRGGSDHSSPIDTIKLKIELNSGEKLYLYEEYYENFDELKEAIRRARFKLD